MHTLKQIAILLLCYCSGNNAHAETIIELNTTGNPPLNTSTQSGFMDQVAKEAFRRIGITLKTVHLPAERGLIAANDGIEDGEMSRIAGLRQAYSHLIQVPEKIMDWEFVVFSNDSTPGVNRWNDLKPYTVAYLNGWKLLERHVPKETDTFKVNTPEQLFNMLKKNHTDLIIYERWAGLLYAKQSGIKSIRANTPALAIRQMFIYLNEKHRALVPKLAAALRQLKDDGTYQQYYTAILSPLTNQH